MPKRIRLTMGLFAALTFLGAGRVRAETLLSFYPLLQITEGYDDNITLAASHPLGDFVTTGVAGFALDFGGGDRTGSLEYDTIFQSFASHPQYNSYAGTNFVTLTDEETLSPDLSMFVNDSMVVGEITGGLLMGTTGAVSGQVAQAALSNSQAETNDFSVLFDRKFGERWTGTFNVTQDFYATGFQTAYMQGGALSLLYALSPKVQTGLSYTFTDFRFSNLPPSQAHTPELVFNWTPTKRLTLDLMGGFVAIDTFGGPSGSFLVRPSGSGTLTFVGERWNISLSGGQVASTTGGLGGAGLNRFVTGVITYALQRHTFAHIGANYSEYLGGGANGSFVSYGAGISTQPRKWLTLYAFYQAYSNSISAVGTAPVAAFTVPPGQTATANTYTIGMKIAFDAYDAAL